MVKNRLNEFEQKLCDDARIDLERLGDSAQIITDNLLTLDRVLREIEGGNFYSPLTLEPQSQDQYYYDIFYDRNTGKLAQRSEKTHTVRIAGSAVFYKVDDICRIKEKTFFNGLSCNGDNVMDLTLKTYDLFNLKSEYEAISNFLTLKGEGITSMKDFLEERRNKLEEQIIELMDSIPPVSLVLVTAALYSKQNYSAAIRSIFRTLERKRTQDVA